MYNYGNYGHHGHNGGGFVVSINRWATPGYNYQQMNGFVNVDYNNGWNANVHDQMLRNNVEVVFQRYDYNRNGNLTGNEFYNAYRDLCLMMGMCPPTNYQQVWTAAMQCDTNGDGMISRGELFMLFKRIQGINAGMMINPTMGNGMRPTYGW